MTNSLLYAFFVSSRVDACSWFVRILPITRRGIVTTHANKNHQMRRTRRWQPGHESNHNSRVKPSMRTKTQVRRESIQSTANKFQRVYPEYQNTIDLLDRQLLELHTRLGVIRDDSDMFDQRTSQNVRIQQHKYTTLHEASELIGDMITTLEQLRVRMDTMSSFAPRTLQHAVPTTNARYNAESSHVTNRMALTQATQDDDLIA